VFRVTQKVLKRRLWLGLSPRPGWRSSRRSPDPLFSWGGTPSPCPVPIPTPRRLWRLEAPHFIEPSKFFLHMALSSDDDDLELWSSIWLLLTTAGGGALAGLSPPVNEVHRAASLWRVLCNCTLLEQGPVQAPRL